MRSQISESSLQKETQFLRFFFYWIRMLVSIRQITYNTKLT